MSISRDQSINLVTIDLHDRATGKSARMAPLDTAYAASLELALNLKQHAKARDLLLALAKSIRDHAGSPDAAMHKSWAAMIEDALL